MSSSQHLREFIRERLTAAAEEIFTEVEKTIVRYEEDIRRLEICWRPQINLTRIDQPKQHVSNKEEVLTDPKLWNQQRSSSLDQEEPEPSQIEEEPEPLSIRGNQQEPDCLQMKGDQEEPEFGEIVVRYQEETRLLDACWNPQIKLTRIDQPKQHVSNKEEVLTDRKLWNQQRSSSLDQEEPEPSQIKQEPEPGPIRGNQQEPDGLQMKDDQEEPEFGEIVVRYQEETRLLDVCWNPQIKLTRIDQPKQHVSNKEEVLTDPKLWNQQRNSSLDQEEPEPSQIEQEPEPGPIRGNLQEPDGLQMKDDQEEPEFGETVVRYQEETRLLDVCWNPQLTRTDLPKQHVWKEEDVLNDPREPGPPQFKLDQAEPEDEPSQSHHLQYEQNNLEGLDVKEEEPKAPKFEGGQEKSGGLDVKVDQEEPDPQEVKVDPEKPEPQQFEEKLENLEGLTIKDLPQIKDEQEEAEPSLFEEDPEEDLEPAGVVENQEEPELSLLEEDPEEDLEPAGVVENQEEPEPSQFNSCHKEPDLLTFLIQSGQQIQQVLSTCETQTLVDPSTSHQRVLSRPEPETEQITEEGYGPELPAPQQEQKELSRSWEEERLIVRTSQGHGWFQPEPDTKRLHCQNPPEDQQSFIELKSFYSCLTPYSEQIHEEPEPPHLRLDQREPSRSWEEEHLIVTTSEEHDWFQAEHDTVHLHYQNPTEHQHRFIQLHSFYSGVTPHPEQIRQDQYESAPIQMLENFCSRWKEKVSTSQEPDRLRAEPASQQLVAQNQNQNQDQDQAGTSSAVSAGQSASNTKASKKCHVCGEVVKSNSLIHHLKGHPGVKPYVCKRCGESFAESWELKEHMGPHLLEEQKARQQAGLKSRYKNFRCSTCRRGFAELAFLKLHSRAHRWERPFCETCGKHVDSLKSHMQIHERRCAKPFFCGLCKKRFASRSSKKQHMKRHKEQEPICYRTWRETLKTSKKARKRKEQPPLPDTLFCKKCNRLFAFKPSYIFHMKSHQKMTRVSCGRCRKKFPPGKVLASHRRTCGRPHSCETCGSHFSSKAGVSSHQKYGRCRGKVESKL